MLAECLESVWAQTVQPIEHLVAIDYERIGTTENVNRLVHAARGEWLYILADDDLMLPHCLETHLAHAGMAEIVYSEPRVEGESWGRIGNIDPEEMLRGGATPPASALIRVSFWRQLGGYRGGRFDTGVPEDRDFWIRSARAGARFVYVPEVTKVYRFHGGNQSRR